MSLLRRIEIMSNLCIYCKYFEDYVYRNRTCAVFDHFGKAIPDEIWKQHHNHRYPHPEDGGIQFERKTIAQLQQHRYFRNTSPEQIEVYFDQALNKLNTQQDNNFVPTNKGHLPPIWFMYDD